MWRTVMPVAVGCVMTLLAGCGGQPIGSDGTSADTTPAALTCTTVTTPSPGYALGVCNSSSQSATVFVNPSVTVTPPTTFSLTAPQYSLSLASTVADGEASSFSFTATNIDSYTRVGAVGGLRLTQTVSAVSTDIAQVTDFHTFTSTSGTSGTITYGDFGTWLRYTTASQGYEGVWFSALGDQSLVTIPTTGSVTFTGVAVGQIAPADATTNGKVLGVSADLSLTVSYLTGTVTGTLSNFMSGSATTSTTSADLVSMPITGTLDLAVRENLSGALVANASGSSAGTGDGVLVGLLVGTGSASVSQLVGSLRFNTTDNRRVLMAFGAK